MNQYSTQQLLLSELSYDFFTTAKLEGCFLLTYISILHNKIHLMILFLQR